ncbi:hypothetical protein MPTK2_4g90280P [Marchantia polymorpha subsp. ruderalis]
MDIRQVALGAAFGAAVAVNAALQSLQDAGSFLIHSPGPSSRSRPVDLLDATTRDARKRPLSFVDDVDDDEDDFDAFKNNDEDEARGPSGGAKWGCSGGHDPLRSRNSPPLRSKFS